MTQRKPNILIVLADQLRACSVGYAGEEPVITPNLDRLAADSAVFTTGISLMPVCTPYRGALLTGRTPLSLGLVLNDIPLRTDEVSIAHAFGEAGYDTSYIGKWHLNGPDRKAWIAPGPPRQGFDFWAAANFDHNYDRSVYFFGDSPEPRVWPGYDAESQTSMAIGYMAEHAHDKPFCMVLSWGPPHHPYRTVAQKYLDLYDPEAIPARPNCPEPPREDLWGYYAQITFLDYQVARLAAALEELGIADDTILVFSSDHGDMHGSHGVYKKQWPWDESIKVPLIVRYPRRIRAGSSFDMPFSVIDVMPTLLGLAGVPIPDRVEGVNLAPFIAGERSDPPRSVLLMNPCPFSIGDPRGSDQVPHYQGMRMEYRGVRTDRYTYARTIDRPWLLFDNIEDPYQLRNLVGDPACKGLAQEMEGEMQALMSRIGDEFLPKEAYYERFGIELDHRGKVKGIIENPYDRSG
jgi:arylsulfatase A-like enzyme